MNRQKGGFTLVELVVVVMILGILAAVAAPRLLETSDTASENGAKQTLAVIRDAIERYAAQNAGDLPGTSSDLDDANFKADLASYLRGSIPKCPVGPNKGSADVNVTGSIGGQEGWVYSLTTGDFKINSTDADSSGVVTYDTY